MTTTEMETIRKELAGINAFVRERFDPVSDDVGLLKEEAERLRGEVARLQERERQPRRRALAGQAAREPVVVGGPYAGMDALDLGLLGRIARSQRRESFGPGWVERAGAARRSLVEGATPAVVRESHEMADARLDRLHRVGTRPTGQHETFSQPVLRSLTRAAMDSATPGSGDELVATLEARQLWMDVNLRTLVAPLVPAIDMPSNPFDIPRQLGDVNFSPGTENSAAAATALGTGRATLEAHELVGHVPYSFTLEEDAVVAMLPEIRAGLVRNVAEVLDDVILNADTTDVGNINADGATISKADAGKGHWLLGYDGILHLPLADNSGQRNAHGEGVSDDMFNEIRARLGKYGAKALGAGLDHGREHLHPRPVRPPVPHHGQAGPQRDPAHGDAGRGGGHPGDRVGADAPRGHRRQGHRRRQREGHGPPADLQPDPVDAGLPAQGLHRRGQGRPEATDRRHGQPAPRSHRALRQQVQGVPHRPADQHNRLTKPGAPPSVIPAKAGIQEEP